MWKYIYFGMLDKFRQLNQSYHAQEDNAKPKVEWGSETQASLNKP